MTEFGAIRCSSTSGTTLPVRIRDGSGTVIVEGISGREIGVAPGRYHVCALLPDGRELMADELVEVVAGTTLEATLDDLYREAAEMLAPMPAGDAVGTGERGGSERAPEAMPLVVRHWRGNWLESQSPYDIDPSGFVGDAIAFALGQTVVLQRDFGADDLLVADYAGKRSIHILPLDECIDCGDGSPGPRTIGVGVHLIEDVARLQFSSQTSADTNAFLGFIEHGLLSESRAISHDFIVRGEAALRSSGSSLLRALLGAYVLLRSNQLEGLDGWIRQLVEVSPDLPDAYAVQAEMLARVGDHDGAVDALRRSLDMPCPWFRSGVSYTLERLRLYIDVHREPKVGFTLYGRDLDRFNARKKQLERAATHLDNSAMFATFR